MEKYRYYIMIAILVMIVPIIYKMTITHHEVTYKVGKYQVVESFEIKNKEHIYKYHIKKNKEEYSYEMIQNVHKRKKLIKEIKEYKEEDIKCIIPIYKNTNEAEIYCINHNDQESNYSLKDNPNYLKILKKAKKYNINTFESSDIKKEYKNISIYSKNIPSESIVIIWNYKGIIGIKKDNIFYQKFLDYDLYDNIMATSTSRYFVLFENTSVNGIEKIHCYDLIKNKYKVITLKEKISKNSYINGVENDLIYITDKRKKKQYTINIKKETCKEVGNEENEFIKYQNGQDQYMKISDFFSKNQYFHNERIQNNKITNSDDLILEKDYYYFREDDSFYKQMLNGNRILLFSRPDVEKWSVEHGDILIKQESQLFLFNEKVGLQLLLDYNELKYNDDSIYYLWK